MNTTDRFFGFAAGTDWLMNFLRLHVLPPIAKHMFSLDAVRRFAFPTISQIGINYRHSSLSNHAGDEEFEVKAGDRLPYFLVGGQNIFDRLQQPKFHVLVFSRESNGFRELDELARQHPELIDFNAFAISSRVEEIFGTSKDFSVLLRPDNHVGTISSDNPLSQVQEYLVKFVGANVSNSVRELYRG